MLFIHLCVPRTSHVISFESVFLDSLNPRAIVTAMLLLQAQSGQVTCSGPRGVVLGIKPSTWPVLSVHRLPASVVLFTRHLSSLVLRVFRA